MTSEEKKGCWSLFLLLCVAALCVHTCVQGPKKIEQEKTRPIASSNVDSPSPSVAKKTPASIRLLLIVKPTHVMQAMPTAMKQAMRRGSMAIILGCGILMKGKIGSTPTKWLSIAKVTMQDTKTAIMMVIRCTKLKNN